MAYSKGRRLADLVSSTGEVSTFTDASIVPADLHATLDLTGKTITVATASASDNDTTVASTAFVQQEIASLVDSAPGTLNTLNELAAALGDDANYATTTTAAIAAKLPLAGGTLTGAVTGTSFTAPTGFLGGSNGGIRIHSGGTKFFNITAANAARDNIMDIGASDARFKDLYLGGNTQIAGNLDVVGQIGAYNNPGSSWGTMGLRAADYTFKNAGGTVKVAIDSTGRLLIGADSGDGFNDDSMLRLQRTGDRVFQQFKCDADQNVQILFGDVDDDVECSIQYHPSDKDLRFTTGNNAEALRIDGSQRVLIGGSFSSITPEEGGTNAGLEVVGSSSGRYNALRLSNAYTVSTGTASTGIVFGAHTNGARDNALIEVQNTANGGDNIEFQIHVRDNANNLKKRMAINWQGNIHSNYDNANVQHYYGSQGGFMGGNSSHNIRAAGTLFMLNAGGGSSQIVLEINGSNRGSVSSSSSSGVFSDRDMKENIQDIEIGLSEVLQLRPRRFKYKTGAHETYGFIAQEVETAVPLSVDEIELPEADPEANKTTLKTLDTTSLIAALVKSVQELEARLTELEG